jgi:hypothetical protein
MITLLLPGRYHFVTIRLAMIQKSDSTLCSSGCEGIAVADPASVCVNW